jgi:hypothetical protein
MASPYENFSRRFCQAESLKSTLLRPFRASGFLGVRLFVGRCPTLLITRLSALARRLSGLKKTDRFPERKPNIDKK